MLPISADIEPAVKSKGKSIMLDIEKAITLSLIDDSWKEHLRNMDELKDSVQGASFEQKTHWLSIKWKLRTVRRIGRKGK